MRWMRRDDFKVAKLGKIVPGNLPMADVVSLPTIQSSPIFLLERMNKEEVKFFFFFSFKYNYSYKDSSSS